nr:hypothetical protein [Dictyobacter kobayashii]
MPVEELVLVGKALDLVFHPADDVVGALLKLAKDFLGNGVSELAVLFPDKGGAPGIGEQFAVFVVARGEQAVVLLFFAMDGLHGIIIHLFHLQHAGDQVAQALPGHLTCFVKERELAGLTKLLVFLFELATDFFVIALNGIKGTVRDAVAQEGRGSAKQAVTALDMSIQEGERLAGLDGLHPQVDFAELDGHGVNIDAIDTMADHITQGGAARGCIGLFAIGEGGGQPASDAVRGGDQEVATATGGITDLEVEDGFFRLLFVFTLAGLFQHRIKGRIEQAINQAGGV